MHWPPWPGLSSPALPACGCSGSTLAAGADEGFPYALVRSLRLQRLIAPGMTTRLDFCTEFTKPDSLKIRLMGTPKNHRSPPA